MTDEEFNQAPLSNILEQYNSSWCDKILEKKKWKKKESKLKDFLEAIKDKRFNPKIPVSHLIAFANRLITDNIIMISFLGMKIY